MIQTALALVLLAAPATQASVATRPEETLTLDDAIARALKRNYLIAIERESLRGAGERIRQAEGAYDLSGTSRATIATTRTR